MLSFSWKWQDEKICRVKALPDYADYKPGTEDDSSLIKDLWAILDQADLVIGHNADRFDIRKANARFIKHELPPPKPYQTIDTLKIARRHFAFTSNKLDDLGQLLGVGRKLKTGGFDLWMGCLQGDTASWNKMKRYNRMDVLLLERVYERLKPWHTNHPNINVNSNPQELRCPACGSSNVLLEGFRPCRTFRTRRYSCKQCGKWSSGSREKIPGVLLT